MITSRWRAEDAAACIDRYAPHHGEDVALRVYTSRLIGGESTLVLHGGGNTSVKSTHRTILGREIPALYVKGSGWDLGTIEPAGLPGLDLERLRELRALESLSDEAMVNELRTRLFESSAPTPSVETLLHAFLPARFIDHSHADAILMLTNTRHGEEHVAACFGDEVVVVPYVMPGFELAALAARLFEERPTCRGMVLIRHGLFTFAETARESYERHLELVNRAEEFCLRRMKPAVAVPATPSPAPAEVLPMVRGALALRSAEGVVERRWILALRRGAAVQDFVNHPDLERISQSGPLTPDHIIRTKAMPLIVRGEGDDGTRREAIEAAVRSFGDRYGAYFERCSTARGVRRTRLDPMPRVILVPGLGLIGVGETAKGAAIAADIYEHTIAVKLGIDRYEEWQGLPELDLFDMEYWSLEQAKLKGTTTRALTGQVALITGGTGAIGVGIARVLRDAGAEVVIADVARVEETSRELGVTGVTVDVTSESSVKAGFAEVVTRFGGIDIVVPNAGIALSRPIAQLTSADVERVMRVNFEGYLLTMQAAADVFRRQSTGGHIVVISSKNVAAPGKDFALYSASKAAGHQLGRVAAIEFAPLGVRVNMVTPDAVFGGGAHPSGLWAEVGPERARSRGLDFTELESYYRDRNLLKATISPEDVGRAVLFFVSNQTPTTGAALPVDGGVVEAFPR